MKLKIFFCYIFLSVCILLILFEGLQPMWSNHLITDFYTFRQRAAGDFVNNEYQPGVLVFFRLFSPFTNYGSIEPFKNAMFLVNICIVFLIAIFVQKLSKPENNIVLGLVILFSGPILLYRFELLVIFLVITSFYFFKKGSYIFSSILLALASMIKVYPIIYLPYFFLILYKSSGVLKGFSQTIAVFFVTSLLFLSIFMSLYNFNLNQLTYSLQFHASKPVGIEGFWSSIISIVNILSTGSPPTLVLRNGTHGISDQALILPMWFLNNFWIFILISLYLWYYFKGKSISIVFLLVLTLVPVIFLKLSSPQYLLWYLILLPIISFEKFINDARYSLLLIISLISAFLNQYIYPLNYSNFLVSFNTNTHYYLFYILVTKYLLLLSVFLVIINLFINSYRKNQSTS